jgi:hypothetical protein
MIGVKKISHASYETPDLERQIAYYTGHTWTLAHRAG